MEAFIPNERREFFLIDNGPKAVLLFLTRNTPDDRNAHVRRWRVGVAEDIDTVVQPRMLIAMEPMLRIPEGMPDVGGYREYYIVGLNEARA